MRRFTYRIPTNPVDRRLKFRLIYLHAFVIDAWDWLRGREYK